jgi:hypothetical protein
MSVESIGNSLFYLIMVGIAALVVSVVMNTGKGGGDLTAISMARSNVQYVGANSGSYTGVGGLILSDIVSMITKDAASNYVLPSGHKITVATNTNTSRFNIVISNVTANAVIDGDLCRKYSYFGVGSKFFDVVVNHGAGGATPQQITQSTMIASTETGCGSTPVSVTLVSN